MGSPLQKLGDLLKLGGEPITDYSWSDVIEAVENMGAIYDAFHAMTGQPCNVYDHARSGPCPNRQRVQGACTDHAVMCSMCGKNLSARGVCPACLDVLAAEAGKAPTAAPAPAKPTDQPRVTEPRVEPPTAPVSPRRARGDDSF